LQKQRYCHTCTSEFRGFLLWLEKMMKPQLWISCSGNVYIYILLTPGERRQRWCGTTSAVSTVCYQLPRPRMSQKPRHTRTCNMDDTITTLGHFLPDFCRIDETIYSAHKSQWLGLNSITRLPKRQLQICRSNFNFCYKLEGFIYCIIFFSVYYQPQSW
jgi:hypothetical protein